MNKIEEAVAILEELMTSNQPNVMEQIWRSGKGELFILKYLNDKDAAAIPSEISDATRTSTARISAALNSLEKKNQIRREIDTSNRRNILVTIEEKGRERISTDIIQMRKQAVDIFTEMGEEDTIELVRLMKHLFEITNRVLSE